VTRSGRCGGRDCLRLEPHRTRGSGAGLLPAPKRPRRSSHGVLIGFRCAQHRLRRRSRRRPTARRAARLPDRAGRAGRRRTARRRAAHTAPAAASAAPPLQRRVVVQAHEPGRPDRGLL